MSEADRLNAILEARAPGLAACLSPLGRQAAFPKGIPFQAGQAKSARLNATIGQVTDGAGSPLPLPTMAAAAGDLDAKTCFLYSPQPGHTEVRELWQALQLRRAGRTEAKSTLPFATHGLSHGLSLVADLFVDADTTVVLPAPSWGNYRLLFGMRTGAHFVDYPFYDGERFHLEAFGAALDSVEGKGLVVLNFPANPTGYSPTPDEADAIVARVAAHPHPLVIVVDDAYQGVVHEDGYLDHSLYWRMIDAADPARHVVLKVDGATKELMFFPSRIGFLTAAIDDEEAEAAWTSKVNGLVRGTVGSPPGPSQALMLSALRDLDGYLAEYGARVGEISARYRALKGALDALDNPRLSPWPFNSAYFALVGVDPSIDVEALRVKLLAERSCGVIAIGAINAIRLAYCSTAADDLPEIVRHIDEVVAAW